MITGTAKARNPASEPQSDPTPPSTQPPEKHDDAVSGTPRRLDPQPNDAGRWLHDKVLKFVLGPRSDAPKRLPAPDPTRDAPLASAQASPQPVEAAPGGLEIHWHESAAPLIASNGDPALDGQTVTLSLRPEKMSISKTRPDAANVLHGKVVDIAYLGNISTYHVELVDGLKIKAQATNTRRVSQRDITWEDDVWISFRDTAGVVLVE
ncbi:MAG TPA: TOBE domain-containing protein [Roseovarius sp.]|nr:TOBE domain-containing protein [Roseovarius sp.]